MRSAHDAYCVRWGCEDRTAMQVVAGVVVGFERGEAETRRLRAAVLDLLRCGNDVRDVSARSALRPADGDEFLYTGKLCRRFHVPRLCAVLG